MTRPSVRLVDDLAAHADAAVLEPSADSYDLAGTTAGVHVVDDATAAIALDFALRGANLVAQVDLMGVRRAEFLDHLRRISVIAEAPNISSPGTLTPEERDLVHALRSGATVAEAAARVGMSRRTASRRLLELRRRFGVESVAGLLAVAEE